MPERSVSGPGKRTAQKKSPSEDGLLNNPRYCRVELDPLNMYRYMWEALVCFRFPVKACRPQATHPVIVLITVQGLLRITNRAGKLGLNCSKIKLCPIHRPFAGRTQGFFSKKFSARRAARLRPAAPQNRENRRARIRRTSQLPRSTLPSNLSRPSRARSRRRPAPLRRDVHLQRKRAEADGVGRRDANPRFFRGPQVLRAYSRASASVRFSPCLGLLAEVFATSSWVYVLPPALALAETRSSSARTFGVKRWL